MTAKEAIPWGWTKAIHPGNEEGFIGYLRSLLASGQPGEIETLQRRYDGKYRWFLFRASPWRDESGKIIKWYGTNTDVEDRKRAEEALRTSEHRLRLMVDSIPGLASTMALNGDAGLVNRRVMDYTGKTLEEMKDWLPAIHPGIGNALPTAGGAQWKPEIPTMLKSAFSVPTTLTGGSKRGVGRSVTRKAGSSAGISCSPVLTIENWPRKRFVEANRIFA